MPLQVVVLYHNRKGSQNSKLWYGGSITSHWPNTNSAGVAISKLNAWQKDRERQAKHSNGPLSFWVRYCFLIVPLEFAAPEIP